MTRYLFTAIGFPPSGSGRWRYIKIEKKQHRRRKIYKTIKNNKNNAEYTKYKKKYKTKNKQKEYLK